MTTHDLLGTVEKMTMTLKQVVDKMLELDARIHRLEQKANREDLPGEPNGFLNGRIREHKKEFNGERH